MGGSGQSLHFFLFLRNSLIVSTIITILQVFFSALAAYAFARLKFPLRNQLFGIYVSALAVPGIVMLIPNFVLIQQFKLQNTFLGIVAPSLF
jgi:multiple sugar transport system permease protein